MAQSKEKRKQWREEDMVSALEAVSQGTAVSTAAKAFNVPRKTLDDHVKGRVQHGTKPGTDTVLTEEEEAALMSYLVYMAQRGFPLTRTMTMAFAWAIAKRAGNAERFNPDLGPGKHWWSNFCKRHPRLTLRKSDKLDRSCAECLNPEVVGESFDLLDKILTDNNLKDAQRQIYNCDETFLPLDATREKVVTLKNTKNVYAQSHGTTEHISMLCAASAAGFPLPPMIIYPKAYPGGAYTFEGPDDALYGKSESGYVDSELFIKWMEKIFLKFAVPERPIILFVDGHKSHLNLDVVDMARNNDVILFCLPPHTTHALQPLDVAVFKSFKNHFSKAVKALSYAKKNFVVLKRDFAQVVKDPFEQAFSIPNIKAGFRKSGIFPFNRNVVDQSKMIPSTLHDLSDASSSSQTEPCGSSNEPLPSSSRRLMTPALFSSPSSDSVAPMSTPSSLHSPGSDNSISIPSTISNSSYTLTSDTPTTNSASNDCSDAELSVLAPNTPSPIVSSSGINSSQDANPTTVANTPPNSAPSSTGIMNPLVRAGLIPAHLADILATPPANAATQRRVRRITKARVLTAREYVEMMEEKEKKEKEAAELKQKRKEEREQKKLEREQKKERRKQEMDWKKRDGEQKQQDKERAERKRKCAEKLQQAPKSKYKCTTEHVQQVIESDDSQSHDSQSHDSQSDDSQSDCECVPESSRPSRKIRDFGIVVMQIQMMMPFSVICARLESQRDASKFHTSGLIVILVENGCIHFVPSDRIMSLVSIYVSIAFDFVKSWCVRPASYLIILCVVYLPTSSVFIFVISCLRAVRSCLISSL